MYKTNGLYYCNCLLKITMTKKQFAWADACIVHLSVSQLPVYSIWSSYNRNCTLCTLGIIFTQKKIQSFSTIYIVFIFHVEQIHFLSNQTCIFFKNISKPTLFTSMFTLVSSLHFCLLLIWIQMYTIIHFLPTQQIIFFQFTDPHPPIPGGYTALWISFLDIADGAQDLAEGCWMFYSRNWTVCVCTYGYVQH